MSRARFFLGAMLAGLAGLAQAQEGTEPVAPASTAFRPGWYVVPAVSWFHPDSKRCAVDNGLGGALALGNRGEFASLELRADYVSAPFDCTYTVPAPTPTDPNATATINETGDLKLSGAGIDMVVGPFFEQEILSRFFGLLGFGVEQEKGVTKPLHDTTSLVGNAGLGYLHPIRLFGRDLGARAEVRYRYDFQQPPRPAGAASSYGDFVINLGLQIPLSSQPEPAPAPQPVAVVPVAYSDADGDGVPDDHDQCPDTPAGSLVNNVGCVPPAASAETPVEPAGLVTLETAKAGDTVVLKGVHFEVAKDVLTADSMTLLDEVARQLQARAELRVEIGGHTDSQGTDPYNQDLSRRRAESVRDYLAGQGVAADRMTAVGYGESVPVDSNDTKAGRANNRRVELKVLE